jgi:hypothetical protein
VIPHQCNLQPTYIRTDHLHISNIYAPLDNDLALKCDSAKSAVRKLPYHVGQAYTSWLDVDVGTIATYGFHIFATLEEVMMWTISQYPDMVLNLAVKAPWSKLVGVPWQPKK